MGLANTMTSKEGSLDLVITNVTVIDPILGVVKADVGVKDGKIAGIGKAGNPNIMHGVHPDLVTSTATDAISGEHLILTAGGIDGHVHMIAPQQAYACLSNGITTVFGGGVGPTDGSNGTTITSGRWNLARILQSFDGLPVNVGLLGKGNCSIDLPLEEQIAAGACGFEDTRGLGLDAGSHTRRTGCCRPLRRTGGHTLRYAQRGRIRRGYDRRDRRPHHTHLSHRGVREAAMRPTC